MNVSTDHFQKERKQFATTEFITSAVCYILETILLHHILRYSNGVWPLCNKALFTYQLTFLLKIFDSS